MLAECLEDAGAESHHVECGENQETLAAILDMLQLECAMDHVIEAHGIVIYLLEASALIGVFGSLLHDAHRAEDHREGCLQVVGDRGEESKFTLHILKGILTFTFMESLEVASAEIPYDPSRHTDHQQGVKQQSRDREIEWRLHPHGDSDRH